MEESRLYDLVERGLLHKWKDKIEEMESDSWFFTREKETYNELEKLLNEEEKKLFKSYSLAIENRLDYVYYNLKIKVLNFGIKIGLELQKAFLEDLEE